MRSKINRDLIWRSFIRQKECNLNCYIWEEKTFCTNEMKFSFSKVIQKPNASSILISIVHLWQISQLRVKGDLLSTKCYALEQWRSLSLFSIINNNNTLPGLCICVWYLKEYSLYDVTMTRAATKGYHRLWDHWCSLSRDLLCWSGDLLCGLLSKIQWLVYYVWKRGRGILGYFFYSFYNLFIWDLNETPHDIWIINATWYNY